MKEMEYLEELTGKYPVLEAVKEDIRAAYEFLKDYYERGGKVLIVGSGGSCADSEHIVGESMKGFVKRRPAPPELAHALRQADPQWGVMLAGGLQGALPAITLARYTVLSAALFDDIDGEIIYAQQLYGYGKKGGVFIGTSTSGNVKSVVYATAVAEAMEIKVIGLAGRDGGAPAEASNVPIAVPEKETFKIRESHLPAYHALYLMLEEHFYEI